MKKQTFKQKTRNLVAGGLIGLFGLIGGCSSSLEAIKNEPIRGYAETKVSSNYVANLGGVIGRKDPEKQGGVSQNLISLSKGPLSVYTWNNYDLQDKEMHEIDYGVSLDIPVSEDVSASIGYDLWTFPSKLLGEHSNNIINASVSHSGIVDTNVKWHHILKGEDVDHGDFITASASKTFELYKNKEISVSATPSIKTTYAKGAYDLEGFMKFTPGVSIDLNKGNFSAGVFIDFQDGKSGRPDQTYFGVKAGFTF